MGGNTGFTTPQQDTQRELAQPRFLVTIDRLLRYIFRTRAVWRMRGYAQ